MRASGDGIPLVRIVDDDEDLRDALQFALDVEGIRAVAYPDARTFLVEDVPSEPGCAILDVRMPGMSGLELQEELARRQWPHPVLFLSAHGDLDMAVVAMYKGAVDFLQKPIGTNDRLVAGVRRAIELDARVNGNLLTAYEARGLVASLTPRELEVATAVSQGKTTPEIAARFNVSERTVTTQRHAVCRKLHVTTPMQIKAILTLAGSAQ